jgi:hypothetical protein
MGLRQGPSRLVSNRDLADELAKHPRFARPSHNAAHADRFCAPVDQRYRVGPAERVWRNLTHGSLPPMRLEPTTTRPALDRRPQHVFCLTSSLS